MLKLFYIISVLILILYSQIDARLALTKSRANQLYYSLENKSDLVFMRNSLSPFKSFLKTYKSINQTILKRRPIEICQKYNKNLTDYLNFIDSLFLSRFFYVLSNTSQYSFCDLDVK